MSAYHDLYTEKQQREDQLRGLNLPFVEQGSLSINEFDAITNTGVRKKEIADLNSYNSYLVERVFYDETVQDIVNLEARLTQEKIKFNEKMLDNDPNGMNFKEVNKYYNYLKDISDKNPSIITRNNQTPPTVEQMLLEQYAERLDWVQTVTANISQYTFKDSDKLQLLSMPDVSVTATESEIIKATNEINKYANYLKANIPQIILNEIEKKALVNDSKLDDDDYNKALNNLKKSSSNVDDLSRYTKHAVGTKGHGDWAKLHHDVQEINSVAKLTDSAWWLKKVGKWAVVPVTVVHMAGLMYDIDFHVPSLKDDFGWFWIGIFSAFVVGVLVIFSHVLAKNLINDQLKPVVKRVFVILFTFSVAASFYFNWRAISNYTHGVIQTKQSVAVATGNSANSLMANTFQNQINQGLQRVNTINTQMQNNNKRLAEIPNQKTILNNKLADAREGLIKLKKIVAKRKQRELIKGYETQIASLDAESDKLQATNDTLQNTLNSLQTQALTLAGNQKKALTALGGVMDLEELQREIFLFVLVLFLEIVAMGQIIAMFIQDKNLSDDHHNKLHEFNSLSNMTSVNEQIAENLKIDLLQRTRRNADINRVSVDVIGKFGEMASKSQIGTLNMITETTGETIQATSEVAKLAVKGLNDSLRFEANQQLTYGLQGTLKDQANTISMLTQRINEVENGSQKTNN